MTGWNSIGDAAGFGAGVLDILVDATIAETGDTVPYSGTIVCNLKPAGLVTGRREGFYVPGQVSNFEPLHPEVGLTAFVQL